MKHALAAILAGAELVTASTILVHGHRGARAVRPENTLAAFEYAIEAGADVLELDMGVTKDDVVVVSHDPEMNLKICRGPADAPHAIRAMTLAQLRQWDCGTLKNPDYPRQQPVPGARVPTLDEVLALAPRGKFHFNIETKIFRGRPHLTPPPEDFARLVLEVVRRHRVEDRVILQSFDFRTLQAMKKLEPRIRLAALIERPRDFVEAAREAGAAIISPQFRLVTADKVKAAHQSGLQVIPWTPNRPQEWDRLIEAGVDAIITDDPAELVRRLRERGLR
jgi:glycerophosphoryl diester phosphodiesterase